MGLIIFQVVLVPLTAGLIVAGNLLQLTAHRRELYDRSSVVYCMSFCNKKFAKLDMYLQFLKIIGLKFKILLVGNWKLKKKFPSA